MVARGCAIDFFICVRKKVQQPELKYSTSEADEITDMADIAGYKCYPATTT